MLALWTKIISSIENEDRGASMVEYALLVVLIAIVAIIAVRAVGTSVSGTFNSVATSLGSN